MNFWFYLKVIYCFTILFWFMGWVFLSDVNSPAPCFLSINLLVAMALMLGSGEMKAK